MSLLHIDTNLASELARDKEKRKGFYKYVNQGKIDVLLNPVLIAECMNGDKKRSEQRVDFLKRIPRKRFSATFPLAVFDLEVTAWYNSGKRASRALFLNEFTEVVNRSNWTTSFRRIRPHVSEAQAILPEIVHGWFFGKNVNRSGTSKKFTLGQYMDPRYGTHAISSEFSRKLIDNHRAYVKLTPNYETGYEEFTRECIALIEGDAIMRFRYDVLQTIEEFGLSLRDTFEMPIGQYLEYHMYLDSLRGTAKNYPKLIDSNTQSFLIKMARVGTENFPGYKLARVLENQILVSADPAKHSDSFDLINTYLIPYVDIFVCDKAFKERIRQLTSNSEIDLCGTRVLTKSDLYQEANIL